MRSSRDLDFGQTKPPPILCASNDLYTFSSFTIHTTRDKILQSMCTCDNKGAHTVNTSKCDKVMKCESISKCPLCTHHELLTHLPTFPDMFFNKNILRLCHKSGVAIEFNALDALKLVKETQNPVRVAIADDWESGQTDHPQWLKKIAKPFDWTFTTDYKGSLKSANDDTNQKINTKSIVIEQTKERIDIERLKAREEILFYEEVPLFEDELADHGVSEYSVKVRVMPSCFFVLARFYLRIDNVLARINDTRLFFDCTKNYILREYTSRENSLARLKHLAISTLTNSTELAKHLPITIAQYEKLILPDLNK